MGRLFGYLQLFGGWAIVNCATMCLILVPHIERFLSLTTSDYSTPDRYLMVGLWVLIEVSLFFLMLIAAVIVVCVWAKVPPGPGWLHLVVDPALVTLICVPFITVQGFAKINKLNTCTNLLESPVFDRPAVSTKCWDVFELVQGSNNTNIENHVLHLHVDASNVRYHLRLWTACLQVAVIVPVIMRLSHHRWRMAWEPLLHSHLYFLLQAVDLAQFIKFASTIPDIHKQLILASKFVTYTCVFISSICCLTVSIPPVYMGVGSSKYLKVVALAGTLLQDLPLLVIRGNIANHEPTLLQGMDLLMGVKNSLFIMMLLLVGARSLCQGPNKETEYQHLEGEIKECPNGQIIDKMDEVLMEIEDDDDDYL